jgi:hypothetical protein
MSADVRVREAAAYSLDAGNGFNMGGKVTVAILSNEDSTLQPSQGLLNIVGDMLRRDDVKVLTDIVEVIAAAKVTVNVAATVKLFPTAAYSTMAAIETALRAEFAKVQTLGRDITESWLAKAMHISGVHSVNILNPVSNVAIPPNGYPIIGTVTLTFGGYSDAEGFGVLESDHAKLLKEANKFYVTWAITNKRTMAQILADLPEKEVPGVISTTMRSVAVYLSIAGIINTTTNEYLPEDEIALLVWRHLSAQYA